jgi:branched-chain amino acid transport system permease protein
VKALRPYLTILATVALLALAVSLARSNVLVNAIVTAMIVAIAGYGWNLLGGYAGQFSFGHAAFFGAGAYVDAVLQARYGINAYLAFALAILSGVIVGLIIGYLSFRAGLRGSYFALVTLAFAEVLRIIANASPITGGAAGTLIKLEASPANFQFDSRVPYLWITLAFVALAMALTRAIERRRLGAYLVAVRENETAARALGIDAFAVKMQAILISAGLTALAGALYAQYFLFVDASIAFGPWISIEALMGPIVGGLGTVFGPLVGALALHFLGEFARGVAGRIPGVDLALFGVLLILVIALARDGLRGVTLALARKWLPARSA